MRKLQREIALNNAQVINTSEKKRFCRINKESTSEDQMIDFCLMRQNLINWASSFCQVSVLCRRIPLKMVKTLFYVYL